MTITESEFHKAESRMQQQREAGYAVAARYDSRSARVMVKLNTGVHITFPVSIAQGLSTASPAQLASIEITPSGLGLHWPKLDADLYVPALLQGVFGSKKWMAQQLGATGGRVRSPAKIAAARVNGLKGGRPRKMATPN